MAEEKKNRKKKSKLKTKQFELSGGRVPPHNLEMERAAICSALIDEKGFARIVNELDENSFYDVRHKYIFEAMGALFSRGAGIDALTVIDELEKLGNLENSGGQSYLVDLTNEVATAAYAEDYAKIVHEKYSLRRLILSSTTTAIDAYDSPDPSELLDRSLQDLFEIYSNKKGGGFQPIGKTITSTIEYLDDLQKNKDGALTGVGTGFDELDSYTSGFQAGDLIIIAARPSMGKTAFCLDIARQASKIYGINVGLFSLEMASMAIVMRLLAAEARIDLHKLRSGKLRDNQWPKLVEASANLSKCNLFIDDTGTLGLMELRARARQLKTQHDIGMIIIDYLQLMKPPKADSREQEVAQISRGLKGLARELEIPVVALSQLSRAVEQRGGDKRPQLSDLRDSGAIEQDADVVMFIYRGKQYKTGEEEDDLEPDNTAEIIIRKQRNGPTGTVKLTFISEYARFDNQADASAVSQAQSFAAMTESSSDDDGTPF